MKLTNSHKIFGVLLLAGAFDACSSTSFDGSKSLKQTDKSASATDGGGGTGTDGTTGGTTGGATGGDTAGATGGTGGSNGSGGTTAGATGGGGILGNPGGGTVAGSHFSSTPASDGFIAPPGTTGLSTDATSTSALATPKFGLLINDLRCAMCHLKINGAVVSTAAVNTWSPDSIGSFNDDVAAQGTTSPNEVSGKWLAASTFETSIIIGGVQTQVPLQVDGGITPNYEGPELPHDPTTKAITFPVIADFAVLDGVVTGTLSGADAAGAAVKVNQTAKGNIVLIGTTASPITINGDVYITGDLVMKGLYTGVGSIYVGGRIYLPGDLKAMNSAFPFPADAAAALAQATQQVAAHNTDALALATPNLIAISDLDSGLYDDSRTPPEAQRVQSGLEGVYQWYPGGKTAYAQLYQAAVRCDNNQPTTTQRSFNMIEALLYSQKAIIGLARQSSYALNGGVIADTLHIVGAAGVDDPFYDQGRKQTYGSTFLEHCNQPVISSVHKLPMNQNYINYDWRLAVGLRLLSRLGGFFQPE